MLIIPRLIHNTFKFDRALLGELHHAARSAITAWLRQRTGQPEGQPGLVVAGQTFGDFLFWHPHVHVLAAAGVFAPTAISTSPRLAAGTHSPNSGATRSGVARTPPV